MKINSLSDGLDFLQDQIKLDLINPFLSSFYRKERKISMAPSQGDRRSGEDDLIFDNENFIPILTQSNKSKL